MFEILQINVRIEMTLLTIAGISLLRRGLFCAPWPCRQFGGQGEGGRKRAGNAGKGKRISLLVYNLLRLKRIHGS